MTRIVIIAGEKSGDHLGAGLIRSLASIRPDARFEGIAGPEMISAGCKAWHASDDLAVMGLFEVLQHLPRLLRIRKDVLERLRQDPPDLLIGIDSPDFNLPVESRARVMGIKTLQYVCPSVWAWRQGRVKNLRRACDGVLCLLPFEAEFLNQNGVNGHFVGHPLAEEIPMEPDPESAREALAVRGEPLVALLPGSRAGEVARLARPLADAAAFILKLRSEAHFVIPVARPGLRPRIEEDFAALLARDHVTLLDGRSQEAMAASDLVILASGTASLEAMLLKRPMVVVYRVSSGTALLLRLPGVLKVQHASLPNLLAAEPLVPELFQTDVNGPEIGRTALAQLMPEKLNELRRHFDTLHNSLRAGGSDAAARVASQLIGYPE